MKKIIPIYNQGNKDKFLLTPSTPAEVVKIGEQTYLTGWFKGGATFSLLGIGEQTPLLEAGILDMTDTIDPLVSLEAVTYNVDGAVIEKDTTLDVTARAVYQAWGNERAMKITWSDRYVSHFITIDLETAAVTHDYNVKNPDVKDVGFKLSAYRRNINSPTEKEIKHNFYPALDEWLAEQESENLGFVELGKEDKQQYYPMYGIQDYDSVAVADVLNVPGEFSYMGRTFNVKFIWADLDSPYRPSTRELLLLVKEKNDSPYCTEFSIVLSGINVQSTPMSRIQGMVGYDNEVVFDKYINIRDIGIGLLGLLAPADKNAENLLKMIGNNKFMLE